MQSINSWLGHCSHCNSYNLQQKILNKCNFIYNNSNNYYQLEEEIINLIENENKIE